MSLACAGNGDSGTLSPPPGAADPVAVLYFIGDAGMPDPAGEPVLMALIDDIEGQPEGVERMVLFLGDNIYPRGMPAEGAPTRADAERRLRAQVDVAVRTATPTIFIPGNHDWDFSGADGWDAVRRQERFVEDTGAGWVSFVPDGGCPGPVVRDLESGVRLVLLDTEWWLRDTGKPVHPTSSCATDSEREIVDGLTDAIRGADGRQVLVVGHHPLLTGGPHGGHFGLRGHVFPLRDWKGWLWVPLPVIGSIYPIARKRGISEQDLSGSRNASMRAVLDSTLAESPALAYVSGHVHGLEVMDGRPGARVLVASGAGAFGHLSPMGLREETLFVAKGKSGYVKIELERSGRARLSVLTVDGEARRVEAWAAFLQELP